MYICELRRLNPRFRLIILIILSVGWTDFFKPRSGRNWPYQFFSTSFRPIILQSCSSTLIKVLQICNDSHDVSVHYCPFCITDFTTYLLSLQPFVSTSVFPLSLSLFLIYYLLETGPLSENRKNCTSIFIFEAVASTWIIV